MTVPATNGLSAINEILKVVKTLENEIFQEFDHGNSSVIMKSSIGNNVYDSCAELIKLAKVLGVYESTQKRHRELIRYEENAPVNDAG